MADLWLWKVIAPLLFQLIPTWASAEWQWLPPRAATQLHLSLLDLIRIIASKCHLQLIATEIVYRTGERGTPTYTCSTRRPLVCQPGRFFLLAANGRWRTPQRRSPSTLWRIDAEAEIITTQSLTIDWIGKKLCCSTRTLHTCCGGSHGFDEIFVYR